MSRYLVRTHGVIINTSIIKEFPGFVKYAAKTFHTIGQNG